MSKRIPEPINWDQLQSLITKIKDTTRTASQLGQAYARHHVKVRNRINTLSKLSNELLRQSHSITREIDRHLADLRKIRAREISDQRRSANRDKQARIRPKLDRSGKRPAQRLEQKTAK